MDLIGNGVFLRPRDILNQEFCHNMKPLDARHQIDDKDGSTAVPCSNQAIRDDGGRDMRRQGRIRSCIMTTTPYADQRET